MSMLTDPEEFFGDYEVHSDKKPYITRDEYRHTMSIVSPILDKYPRLKELKNSSEYRTWLSRYRDNIRNLVVKSMYPELKDKISYLDSKVFWATKELSKQLELLNGEVISELVTYFDVRDGYIEVHDQELL